MSRLEARLPLPGLPLPGLPLLGLLACLALGCAARPADKDDDLHEAIKQYNQHQRWGDFRSASRWVAPAQAEGWLKARQRAAGVRVADLQLLQVVPGEPPEAEATAIVQLSWYREPSMRLEQTTRTQRWQKQEAGWRVVEEGVAEAAPETPEVGGASWP